MYNEWGCIFAVFIMGPCTVALTKGLMDPAISQSTFDIEVEQIFVKLSFYNKFQPKLTYVRHILNEFFYAQTEKSIGFCFIGIKYHGNWKMSAMLHEQMSAIFAICRYFGEFSTETFWRRFVQVHVKLKYLSFYLFDVI